MRYIDYMKRNIRRTPYQAMAASMVMFLTFLTILMFILIVLGSQKILQHVESKPQAIAFFKDNTQASDVRAIQNALLQTGKVTNLKYVSKEEALKIYQEKNKDKPLLVELVTASILPASLEISTTAPKDLEPLAQMLRREPVVDEVIVPVDVVENLAKYTSVIRTIGAGLVIFLIAFSLLIILMIIGFKIRLKRTEIEIMKLLGASTWFIRAPFMLEGITYGIIGATVAWIVSYLILWYLTPFVQGWLQNELTLLPASPLLMLLLLLISLTVALFIGFLGSYGALRRYLKL